MNVHTPFSAAFALVLFAVAPAFGQGQILFQNNSATAITNALTGQKASPLTMVGLYLNANTAATEGSAGWSLQATTNLISPVGGLFFGGVRTTTFPVGTPVAVQVRAWLTTVPQPSFEAAIANVGPNAAFGTSVIMVLTPTASPSPTVNLISNGLQPFQIGIPIPEPPVSLLGLIGLAAVAVQAVSRHRGR